MAPSNTPPPASKRGSDPETKEIIMQGRNVAMGYWNNPEATAAAFNGDIYHTGDVGALDATGKMIIVDRLGMQFKNDKGIFVQAGRIANDLQGGIVKAAVVGGANKAFNIAHIILNPSVAETLTSGRDWANDPAVQSAVFEKIAEANAKNKVGSDKIKGFVILPRALDKEKEMTPTGKIKPKEVLKSFAADADAIYAAGPNVAPNFL